MAQTSVARLLDKPEFPYPFGLDPGRIEGVRRILKRTIPGGNPVHLLPETGRKFSVESGPDLARIAQAAIVIMIADQQSAKVCSLAAGLGEATNDQFLATRALEFQPVPRTPVDIPRIGTLGDQTFPTLVAGLDEVILTVAISM